MTWNVQVLVRPAASCAVQVTVVVPAEKNAPLGGAQLMVAPGQLSLGVAVKVTTSPHNPGSPATTRSLGQFAVGSSASATVTVNEQLTVCP